MPRQPRVFISRTTAGLAALAERVAEVLRQRGIEPIIQTGFYPSTHDVKGMLAEHLQQCDAVICLIGSAYGSGPHDPITKTGQPVHGLKDPRTKDRLFSYTQLELLIARDLGRPIYTFFIEGDELPTAFAPEPPELAQRQQTFITEFAKDGRNTYGTFSQWDQPADPARGLKQAIEAIQFEITVLAGKPTNLPYTSLGTLFKGRDEFLAELRQHLTAEGPVVIKGKRTIHGMGGVGKTRAAIEYAWKHADDYRALLFISADTPESLHRNLAALCGPLVLNLPEQNEKEQALQVEAALRWMKLHPGWFLIIDNVDTDEAAEETKALLAKLATGHVLITSRISDWTGHVKSLDLDVLSEAASIAFLDERTEERRPKKDDDCEKVAALVQLLDRLALALEQAGAHISTRAISYADYIALWESHRPEALAWHDEEKMKYPKSLAITYETSVAQLSDGAKELFRILSWFAADPIPRSLFSPRAHELASSRHLGELERLHLARYFSDGKRFSIHRLNQEITRQKEGDELPSSLNSALVLLEGEMPQNTKSTRFWPIAIPLTPHAIAAVGFTPDNKIPLAGLRLMNATALLLATQAKHRDAEPLMRRDLSAIETSYGPSHRKTAIRLGNLGILLQDTDRFGEAETLLRRAKAIIENSYGEAHSQASEAQSNLAALFQKTNRHKEAESLLRKALANMEGRLGIDHHDLAVPLSNLGQLLKDLGKLSEAETIMRRALSIEIENLGDDAPEVARSLSNLALLLESTDRFEEAMGFTRRALEIDEACFGKDHPNVARDLNNLGGLLKSLNRLTEAEPLVRRALSIYDEIYGSSSSRTSIALRTLATILVSQGRNKEAESLLRRVLAIDENVFGENHFTVAEDINNLATILHGNNRQDEALPLFSRALEITRASLGECHPNAAVILANIAQILQANNQYPEAEQCARRALAINEAVLGERHQQVGKDLNNLAVILQAAKRYDEAIPLMQRALAIFESCFGPDHPLLASSLGNLGTILFNLGRLTEAEPLMKRALCINEDSMGPNHPCVAIALSNLALLLKALKGANEAEPLIRRSFEILLRHSQDNGQNHPNLTQTLNCYGNLLFEITDDEAEVVRQLCAVMEPYDVCV